MNTTITKDSRVSIGFVLVVGAAIIGGWTNLVLSMNDMRHTLRSIEEKISGVVIEQQAQVDRAEWRAWARELQALNQELVVPMPD